VLLQFLVRHTLSLVFERETSNRAYIEHLYRYFLKTPHCQTDIDFHLERLDSREISRVTLIFSFLMIPAGWEQRIFRTQGLISHHRARVRLVQDHLPPARRILDLGGAAGGDPSGGLLSMGYAHKPERIDIVDLPVEERFSDSSAAAAVQSHTTPDGTEVHYHYMSMTRLTGFPDSVFDMAWSGQSIEHITPAEARVVIEEVYRVLKPGGHFCLDTPNRRLTMLQVRRGFVHPEHKIEYLPSELAGQLVQAGFTMVEQRAVSPMPLSQRAGRFSRLEFIHSTSIGDDPDTGYSFYLRCEKPLRTQEERVSLFEV
jgi:SAM-dependent methyltransferase